MCTVYSCPTRARSGSTKVPQFKKLKLTPDIWTNTSHILFLNKFFCYTKISPSAKQVLHEYTGEQDTLRINNCENRKEAGLDLGGRC